jgi:hypothetical protein
VVVVLVVAAQTGCGVVSTAGMALSVCFESSPPELLNNGWGAERRVKDKKRETSARFV